MSLSKLIRYSGSQAVTIKQWKAKEGDFISTGAVLFTYTLHNDASSSGNTSELKYKSDASGSLEKIMAEAGKVIEPGLEVAQVRACQHAIVMKDMCAECGADLQSEDTKSSASVAMLHSIPELRVSKEQAETIGKRDTELLLKSKKLVLLVDLDQTLIHTTNDEIPANIKDVYHFQLYGSNSPWYHTRFRPGTRSFLENISKYYELHICTFGARLYAHTIARFLDPDGVYFSNRILSRDECFNQRSKTANLRALFPCGDNMVCIIDDREDVWNYAPNLVHVKPYHFFKHTGDINAPPGLEKGEQDEKEGFDFSALEIMAENKPEPEKPSPEVQRRDSMPNLTDDEDSDEKTVPLLTEAMDKKASEELNADLSLSEDEADETTTAPGSTKTDLLAVDVTKSKESEVINSENPVAEATEKSVKEISETKTTSQASAGATESPTTAGSASANPAEARGESSADADIKNGAVSSERLPAREIEVHDNDDYLLHLEDILKLIHRVFYSMRLRSDMTDGPDLRLLIPYVRKKVLKGVRLVFSGVVPSNVQLISSRPYQVAVNLGATVQEKLVRKGPRDELTTHLVAARFGTAKVNEALRSKRIQLVTLNWLWVCAERWERIDERVFPLRAETAVSRTPPAHCSSPDPEGERSRRQSFQESLNPLLTFSPDDIARMDEEVEDILMSDDPDDDDEPARAETPPARPGAPQPPPLVDDSSDDSSEPSQRRRAAKRPPSDESSDDESPSVKFRRGEPLPSDDDLGGDGNDSDGGPDLEEDWSMMGAELERELGGEE